MSFLVSLIASIAIQGLSSAVVPMYKNDIISKTVPARIGTPPQEAFLAVIFSADQTRVFPQDSSSIGRAPNDTNCSARK